jgi:hypothetical protein
VQAPCVRWRKKKHFAFTVAIGRTQVKHLTLHPQSQVTYREHQKGSQSDLTHPFYDDRMRPGVWSSYLKHHVTIGRCIVTVHASVHLSVEQSNAASYESGPASGPYSAAFLPSFFVALFPNRVPIQTNTK